MAKNTIFLRFKVIKENGEPIENASLGILLKGQQDILWLKEAPLGSSEYEGEVPSGTHTLVCVALGYQEQRQALVANTSLGSPIKVILTDMEQTQLQIKTGFGQIRFVHDGSIGAVSASSGLEIEEDIARVAAQKESGEAVQMDVGLLPVGGGKTILRFGEPRSKEDNANQLLQLRKDKQFAEAGPLLELEGGVPVILTNKATIGISHLLRSDQARELLGEIGAISWTPVTGTGNVYQVAFPEDWGIEMLAYLDGLVKSGKVLHAEPVFYAEITLDVATPTDFLWAGDTTRNERLKTKDAWDLLEAGGKPAFGNPHITVAVIDTGVLSVGGKPENSDLGGGLSNAITLHLTAAVASPPRAILEVESVAGISIGDYIQLGVDTPYSGDDSYLRVYGVDGTLNQLTVDPLQFDHPGKTGVYNFATHGLLTFLKAGGAKATVVDLQVGSTAGFELGQAISIEAEGDPNCEQVVVVGLTATEIKVRGLRKAHPIGTDVIGGQKMYKFWDFDSGNFGANNDAITDNHGTACAGIVSANQDGSFGSLGMAPNTRLMGLHPQDGDSARVRGVFQWATGLVAYNGNSSQNFTPRLLDRGADIITCSIGYDDSAGIAERDAAISSIVRRARNGRGGLVIMSAGNDAEPMPSSRWSSHPQAFAIGATWLANYSGIFGGSPTVREEHASYSNYSDTLNGAVVNFVALSGASTISAVGPRVGVPGNRGHNPPNSYRVVTTAFKGKGNVPASNSGYVESTMDWLGVALVTSMSRSIRAGATILHVDSSSGFVVGDKILLGQWGEDTGGRLQWVDVTGVPSATTLTVTPLPLDQLGKNPGEARSARVTPAAAGGSSQIRTNIAFNKKHKYFSEGTIVVISGSDYRVTSINNVGTMAELVVTPNVPGGGFPNNTVITIPAGSSDLVSRSLELTVNSVAGITPNTWVMLGNPAFNNWSVAYVHSTSTLPNKIRLMEPLNIVLTGDKIYHGPLDYQNRFNGTSAAAPNASGIAALVLSANPDLTWLEVKDIFKKTAKKIDIGKSGVGVWRDSAGDDVINGGGGLAGTLLYASVNAAGYQGDVTIEVDDPTGFTVGQAILVGGTFTTIQAISGNVFTIDPLLHDVTTITVVMGGRTPYFSDVYGYGRLDPAKAVQAALAYTGNERDMVIRNFIGDDGIAPTDPAINPILSPDIFIRNLQDKGTYDLEDYSKEGPHETPSNGIGKAVFAGIGANDIRVRGYYKGAAATYLIQVHSMGASDQIVWKKDANPFGLPITLVANTPIHIENGIYVTFKSATGHTTGDNWTIIAAPADHFIYVRLRNRGTSLDSLYGTALRYYVATTDGTLLGNGKTPFHFTPGWNDTHYVSNIANANSGSNVYLVNNPLAPGGPNDDTLVSVQYQGNPLYLGEPIYPCKWLYHDVPPVDSELRLFLMAEVLPHDGKLAGASPDINNNVSYREIFFGNIEILNGAETEEIPGTIEVDNAGTNVNTPFNIRITANLNKFETEEIEVSLKRRDKSNVPLTTTFSYDGGVWGFDVPAWCNLNAPVLTGTGTAASGKQSEVTFSGDFDITNAYNLVEIEVRLKGVHGAIILSEKLEITIFSEPDLGNGTASDGVIPAETPRPHEFADMLALSDQATTPQLAFGYDYGLPAGEKFRVTSSFNISTAVPAYACMRGYAFVQRQDDDRVNLIIKPLEQSGMGFTAVKYFVYRGLKLTHFLVGSPNPTDLRTVIPEPGSSEFIQSLYDINADINAALGTSEPLSTKAFGWDPDNQVDLEAYLDDFFYAPDAAHQLPVVTKGMYLGDFAQGLDVGFEIVLADSRLALTLGYARQEHHDLETAGLTGLALRAKWEEVLSFMDPAAYYGLHYFGGVEKHGIGTPERAKDLYDKVLVRFATKNRVYLDIRNDNGYSYNFYRNYFGVSPEPYFNMNIRYRDAGGVENYGLYLSNGWPMLWFDAPQTTTAKVNVKHFRLRIADNQSPVLFVEHAQVVSSLQKDRFVDSATLLDADDPAWTKEVSLAYPNYDSTGVNVSTMLKLHYCRAQPFAVTTPPTVVKPSAFNDNLFGPVEALTRTRAITAINQVNKEFTVTGNFSNTDPGEFVFVYGSTGGANDGKYTVVTATAVGLTTVVKVAEAIPSPTVAGSLEFSYTLWNTDKPTRWIGGFRKHFVDATLDPVDASSIPVLGTSGMMESGAAVEANRVIFYAQPYHFLQSDPVKRSIQRVNMHGGVGLQASFWTEILGQNPNLKLSGTSLKIGTTLIPVFEFDRVDPITYAEKPENFAAICITDQEFAQIREAIVKWDFSPHHEKYLALVQDGPELTDANGNKYFRYHIHIQGLDNTPSHNAMVKSSQFAPLHIAPVTVYVASANRLIYSSEAFASLENFNDEEDNYEEAMRLAPIPISILSAESTMNSIWMAFDSSLNAIVDDKAALKAQVEASARQLWSQAVAYNAAAPFDDRPVYWARLHANVAIKNHPFVKKQRKLKNELVEIMEGYSRGRNSVDFTASNPAFTGVPGLASAKKILVTGYDPFQGSDSYNPAGLVALALHNQVITDGLGNTGLVQAAVFPVRYRDFDAGVVENFVEKYLKNGSPDQVKMLMTISLYGGGLHFFLERYAGRYRSGSTENMNETSSIGNIGRGGSWKQFFETTLPVLQFVPTTPGHPSQEIYYNQHFKAASNGQNFPVDPYSTAAVVGMNQNVNIGPVPIGNAETGSGGAYLSNEIFYRVARLREALSSTTKTGHLHIPDRDNADPVKTDAQIIQVVRNAIQRSLTAL